jgi:hypothetical protein
MTMQTGPIQLIETVPLTLSCEGTFKTVMIDLKDLEMLSSDDNYVIYKSDNDTEYCKANTIIVLDLNTKTIRITNIPTDPHADAIKIYKDNTKDINNELIFIATLDNDINIYNLAAGQHIKKLNAGGIDYAYLINKIYIFKPDAENMFVLTDNYKYNTIWHYKPTDNSSRLIPYPKELQHTIRYFISNSGSKIIKKHLTDGRDIQVEAGKWLQTVYTNHREQPLSDYDINYDYYLNKIRKEIESLDPSTNQLSLF